MQAMDDMALLREYAARNSETAFETLVSRRIGFVYSAALRQVRDPNLAEEVTQAVFIILAQKAGRISGKTILAGWLFRTTRFAALAQMRADAKRRRREQEANMQSELQPTAPDLFWEQMSPLLDEALATLGETDRQAVLLRFFENKSLAEVGRSLGTGEDTARKRVARALEKLHRYFSKHGISSTTNALAEVISANSIQVAPAMLAKSVTAVAMAKGAAASGSTLTLIKGALKIMAWTKAKTAIVVGLGVLLAAGTTTVTIRQINKNSAGDSWRSLNHFKGRAAMLATLDKTPPQVTILPTMHPDYGAKWWPDGSGRSLGMNSSVTNLLSYAYGERTTHMVFSGPTVGGKYDYIANLPHGSEAAFRQKIKEQFGVEAHKTVITADVWMLKVSNPEKIKTIINTSGHTSRGVDGSGEWKEENATMANLADALEGMYLFAPVIDRTGLHGKYDFSLSWDCPDISKRIPMITDELKQVGIELVPSREPVEMLVVEKTR